ncbi:MAG TPA: hypothetical protein VN023_05730 [Methylovorus sp.]|nr:hypothetical protein [Methylovorus sp.]
MKTLKSTHKKHLIFTLLPLATTLTGACIFHDFVLHSIRTSIVINSIIIAAAAVGAMLMIVRIRDIRWEWQVFEDFADGGKDDQAAVSGKSKSIASHLIARVQHIRLTQQASMMQQGQVQEALEYMEHILERRQEAAQYVVGLMIALGLLGTFIGLLETLVAVGNLIGGFANADTSQNMDQALTQLIGTLQYPLTAMGTAFSASMFGLLCSLMLGIMMLSVRAFQVEFMQYARGVIEHVIAEVSESGPMHAEVDQSLLQARMDELQRLQQSLQGEVRALVSQGAGQEARLSRLLDAMDRIVALSEKTEHKAEKMNTHLASLPALVQLTDRMGHSVEQLAAAVVHAQRQSDMQHQSLAKSLIQQSGMQATQLEQTYAEHARHSHQMFSEMLEQRLSAIEERNAEAGRAQQAVLNQHAIFERIFNAISEANALTMSMMERQHAIAEAHTQATRELHQVVVDMLSQQMASTANIEAGLTSPGHIQVMSDIGQDIARGFERLESELRVGLAAILALHRQTVRQQGMADSTVKEKF